MIAVSTAWNADRHSAWAPAVAELLALGRTRVALDGAALHGDGTRVRAALRETMGEVVALFAPRPRRDEAGRVLSPILASPRAEVRTPAVAAALAAARAAADAGTATVVLRCGELPGLDPSREARWLDRLAREGPTEALAEETRTAKDAAPRDRVRFVESLCRALFDAARAAPDVSWALETPGTIAGLPTPHEAETIFDELPRRRIGYWHDAAHAACLAALGAVPAEEWLERLGPHAVGVTLADWSPQAGDLPPGAGVVDWRGLSGQLTAPIARVLRLDPSFPAPLLLDALREAESLGLDVA